jgi:hypothetical protein
MSEVADIFRKYGQEYRKKHRLPLHHLKVMDAIEKCRTSYLGGHVDECDSCGHINISYNSCRNRHCPKCQACARERWLGDRMEELLPVGYFHVVFTIPQELNALVLRNRKAMYAILFKAASETLLELGRDLRHLGAEIGFISVLHTWGQNMMEHPHLHCIVPAGGLSFDEERWIHPRKKDFFVPVDVLSSLFRGKFLSYLGKAYEEGKLKFPGEIGELNLNVNFNRYRNSLYGKKWITYCKPPFGGPEQVLEYIGRYTHRVAISNRRIIKVEHGQVTFKYRDYKDKSKTKEMTVTAEEFIRRFLLHILPDGFVKIRYYGLLSSRNKKSKLNKCRDALLQQGLHVERKVRCKDQAPDIVEKVENPCPCCRGGIMRTRQIILPNKHSPPGSMRRNHVA